MYRSRIGQRAAGGHGLYPREGQRFPGFGSAGGDAGRIGRVLERLDAYEEEGPEELARRTGKCWEKRTKQIKKDNHRSKKRVSRTDPEAGHMRCPESRKGRLTCPTRRWIGTMALSQD